MDQTGQVFEELGIRPTIEAKSSSGQAGSLSPPVYESMVATSKFMTTNMNEWDWVWRQEHEPSETPRFGSLFRQFPGLPEYYQMNIRPHYRTGIPGPSFADWEKAVVGLIGIEIDRKDLGSDELNLQAALDSARQVVRWLRQNGVRDESWTAFVSGLKGISLHFLPEVFGSQILEIGPGYRLDGQAKINQGHKRAAYLALEALCNEVEYDVGSYQTLRLFRIPNSKHDKAPRYKVPLLGDESLGMNAAEIMALAEKPRLGLKIVPSNVVDPALVRMLEEKHRQALEVDAQMEEKERTRAALRGPRVNRSGNNDKNNSAQEDQK